MGQRTIGVQEEVYNRLKKLKRSNESFSDLIKRLTEKEKPAKELLKYSGAWKKHEIDTDTEKIKEKLEKDREKFEARH